MLRSMWTPFTHEVLRENRPALAEGKMLKEGASIALSKSNAFAGQHF